eukprot:5288557-Alexandrium_andersonii.AAC.1
MHDNSKQAAHVFQEIGQFDEAEDAGVERCSSVETDVRAGNDCAQQVRAAEAGRISIAGFWTILHITTTCVDRSHTNEYVYRRAEKDMGGPWGKTVVER